MNFADTRASRPKLSSRHREPGAFGASALEEAASQDQGAAGQLSPLRRELSSAPGQPGGRQRYGSPRPGLPLGRPDAQGTSPGRGSGFLRSDEPAPGNVTLADSAASAFGKIL